MNTETWTSDTVKKVRFIDVDVAPGPARCAQVIDVDVTRDSRLGTKDGHRRVIEDAVSSDTIPGGLPQNIPSNLDIDIGWEPGTVAFAIRLPTFIVVNGNTEPSHLVFRSTPFRALPSNYSTEETYLLNPVRPSSSNRRWAWFELNLEWIRNGSRLADRIRRAHHHPHQRRAMRIPFMLNVIDRQLGFAPWMLPLEPLQSSPPCPPPPHETVSEEISAAALTHGGVHPTVGNYVTMDV